MGSAAPTVADLLASAEGEPLGLTVTYADGTVHDVELTLADVIAVRDRWPEMVLEELTDEHTQYAVWHSLTRTGRVTSSYDRWIAGR